MSTSYTEKTHSAFHGAPIDTSDAVLSSVIRNLFTLHNGPSDLLLL